MNRAKEFQTQCPIPLPPGSRVLLGHGSGGKLTRDLIKNIFSPFLSDPLIARGEDSAVLDAGGCDVMTTDSYVVQPLFFPGGDIGMLAVNGSVNDLAVMGAEALYLSLGFILEEGFELEKLAQIAQSISKAAKRSGVRIVAADTKVVEKGKADGVFINACGLGKNLFKVRPSYEQIQEGDVILVSGDIGRHGMAIMSARQGLEFENPPTSDCAPLLPLVRAWGDAGAEIHCMRDLTRGGLATALKELADSSAKTFQIHEKEIPVEPVVRGACEILGIDPLYVANEGCLVAFFPEHKAEEQLAVAKKTGFLKARIVGRVIQGEPGRVMLKHEIGSTRLLELLTGDPLPRIC